ncbi:hypothetical protein CC86DRAFT_415861, partial [Ophiobolus disseminans]
SVAAQVGTFAVVEIGTTKKKYFIHRSLLEEHSEYFRKALNGPWIESQEGVVKLHDVDCGNFDIFVDWLYTCKCPQASDAWATKIDGRCVSYVTELTKVKCCAFGDRVLAPAFQTSAQAAIIQRFANGHELPSYETIIFAFAHLPLDSIVLTLLVDAHCQRYKEKYDCMDVCCDV